MSNQCQTGMARYAPFPLNQSSPFLDPAGYGIRESICIEDQAAKPLADAVLFEEVAELGHAAGAVADLLQDSIVLALYWRR